MTLFPELTRAAVATLTECNVRPADDLEHFDLAAWESIEGGVLVAFGANNSPSLGGSHGADGHMDAILLHATFEVDGLAFVTDGVPAAMLETA